MYVTNTIPIINTKEITTQIYCSIEIILNKYDFQYELIIV